VFQSLSERQLRRSILSAAALLLVGASAASSAATLSVGPGKTFSTPCRAFAAAANGDIIEIDASGSYVGDVCGIYPSNLTIRGVNGRPKIDAGGLNSMGKGTWVVEGNNTTVQNVEMYGAKVADNNGAAIRLDGQHLTVTGSYIHDNQNGILTNNDGVSNIVIENTEFAFNGYGDGYTHNLYIGHVNSLVFRGSYSHDAKVGHNLKSRANTNTIVYSRFSSTMGGSPSYEIDLPNAGTSYVIGNIIQQPANNSNPSLLAYGEEGASNSGQDLYVVNNTFLNDDSSRGTFIMVGGGVSTPVLMQNNVFGGTGTTTTQGNATDRNNYRSLTPAFVDRANFDLRPASGSPMINAGAAPGNAASGFALNPTLQYLATAQTQARPVNGTIDIGAYEAAATATTSTTSPTTTSTPTVTSTPSTTSTTTTVNWTTCASEWGTCNFSGTRQVRYGANGSYYYKSLTGPVACTNDTFGDPAVGYSKSCAYADSTTSTTPTTSSTTTSTASWTTCASEWGTCSFSGTALVRYGANGSYYYQTATGSISCTNSAFGDPAVGYTKSCAYQPTSSSTTSSTTTTPTTWVNCSGENGYCSFSGTRQVRYGISGSYYTKTFTGGVSCNNATFGDPAVGYYKTCDYAN
jgi:hypothetical protein